MKYAANHLRFLGEEFEKQILLFKFGKMSHPQHLVTQGKELEKGNSLG